MAKPSSSSSSSWQHTEKSLTEEREEDMVSEKGHTFTKTHFLKPFVTSINDSNVASLPRLQQRLSVSSSSTELKRLSARESFTGFRKAESSFLDWLVKMEALHEPTWKKAGIFEAIKASAYNITRDHSLILSISEKWCPETKSFVFPWGEATITLEDVMVLLGFSVLGSNVFDPIDSLEMKDDVEKLEKTWKENKRGSRDSRVNGKSWTLSFLGKGDDDDDMEHEAFLVLWLSMYVFPTGPHRNISEQVFPIAVRLSRGERIALAPAVLAGLYRDLDRISGLFRGKCDGKANIKSLFKLVQVWVWERFKNTRPKPREIPKGEPRISRWHCLQRKSKIVFDEFDWRPYTKPLKNWTPLRFYINEGMWLNVGESFDDEFVSFARCVRVSHLVGDGFVESYYPHRVAMQFGLAQDLPGLVTRRRNFTEKEAWEDYSKSLDGLKLYMPSRLARGSVTRRYKEWWLKSVSEFLGSKEIQNETSETFDDDDDDDDDISASLKVLPLSQVVKKLEENFPTKHSRSTTRSLSKKSEDLANKRSKYQSVLQMKRAHEDDDMFIAKRTRTRKKHSDSEKATRNGYVPLVKRARKFQVADSDDDDDQWLPLNEENDEPTSGTNEDKPFDDKHGVHGSNVEKKMTTMIKDDRKKQECLLHEDIAMARDKASTDFKDSWPCRNLGSVEIEKTSEETASKVQNTRQVCDDDAEKEMKKKSVIDDDNDWIKKARSWLHECREEKRCTEKMKEEVSERSKQRKTAIEEQHLKLEASLVKMEKILAEI